MNAPSASLKDDGFERARSAVDLSPSTDAIQIVVYAEPCFRLYFFIPPPTDSLFESDLNHGVRHFLAVRLLLDSTCCQHRASLRYDISMEFKVPLNSDDLEIESTSRLYVKCIFDMKAPEGVTALRSKKHGGPNLRLNKRIYKKIKLLSEHSSIFCRVCADCASRTSNS